MIRFLMGRIGTGVLVLFAIATISFFIVRFAPGDPFSEDKNITREARESLKKRYYLDQPAHVHYGLYLGDIVTRGNLGYSYRYRDITVNEILANSFPISLRIGICALLLSLSVGIPMGTFAAARKGRFLDHATMTLGTMGISVPNFVVGPLLVMVCTFVLGILPPAGWGGARHMVLPVLALAAPLTAYISRLTRGGMVDVLQTDYVRTARAKGLPQERVIFGHALRNAIIPVISYLGPACASVVTGSVVVETIFSVPGVGRHFVNAALNRDYTLVMGTVLLYSALLVALNVVADVVHAMLDPRVRLGGRARR